MSQASRHHAMAPLRERLSVIKFIARADPDCGEGIITHPPDRSKALHGLLGYDVQFNVAKVRAEANLVRLYGKHAHRVKRRHDVDSRGRPRWASPVGDWADEAPGEPWPYMDGDDLALVRVAEAVLRAIDGQPSECTSCSGYGVDLETIASLPQRDVKVLADRVKGFGQPGNALEDLHTEVVSARLVCRSCAGSGQNLLGDLGLIDVSPQLLRRMTEGEGGYYADTMAPWLNSITAMENDEAQALELIGPHGADPRTRVVARGEHRHHGAVPEARQAWMDAEPGSEEREAALDLVISERRWAVWGDDGRPYPAEPRWLSGEIATLDRRRRDAPRRFMWAVGREIKPAVEGLAREVREFMEAEG